MKNESSVLVWGLAPGGPSYRKGSPCPAQIPPKIPFWTQALENLQIISRQRGVGLNTGEVRVRGH